MPSGQIGQNNGAGQLKSFVIGKKHVLYTNYTNVMSFHLIAHELSLVRA